MTDRTFTTAQAARLLGVKADTVYAYVSRGLLSRTRAADGRTSRFDAEEVRRLAARNRRGAPESAPIETALTVIRDGELYYRGRNAAELAAPPLSRPSRICCGQACRPRARRSWRPSPCANSRAR
ncbi:helix-turn-helix domain-containing protein [Amycolatopsis sp. NPDC051106]|uniref:helix-turn-helix domain-containing protein n=1 Tax=unclassified Amycolatopsis TaxID=2618356 RepID=UPI00342A56AC